MHFNLVRVIDHDRLRFNLSLLIKYNKRPIGPLCISKIKWCTVINVRSLLKFVLVLMPSLNETNVKNLVDGVV